MIGFADNAIIICPESNLELLEMKVNESLRRVKMWLESRKLALVERWHWRRQRYFWRQTRGHFIILSLKLTTW